MSTQWGANFKENKHRIELAKSARKYAKAKNRDVDVEDMRKLNDALSVRIRQYKSENEDLKAQSEARNVMFSEQLEKVEKEKQDYITKSKKDHQRELSRVQQKMKEDYIKMQIEDQEREKKMMKSRLAVCKGKSLQNQSRP